MAFTLRTDETAERQLTHLAERLGRSKHDVALLAISALYEKTSYDERVDDLLDRTRSRYADALRRLGE